MSDRKIEHRQCEVEGCTRPVYVKNKCKAHYQREWVRNRKTRPCSVPGCDLPDAYTGMCHKHYTRQKEGYPRWNERELFAMQNPPKDGVGKIPLGKGLVALVDAEDYDRVMKYVWHAERLKGSHTYYAKASIPSGKRGAKGFMWLHRFIMGCLPRDRVRIDHRSRNGLDCRKGNLRRATASQNSANSPGHVGRRRSRFKGLTWLKKRQKWMVQMTVQGRHYHFGCFKDEEEAARAYNAAAKAFHGEFAWLNPV